MKRKRVGLEVVAVIYTRFTNLFSRCAFASLSIAFLIAACDTSNDGCECEGELDDDGVCLLTDEALEDAQTTDQGIWQSVPWQDAPWHCFDAGMKVRLSHPLGYPPAMVQIYLSFTTSDDGPGKPFLASGDLARIVEVTDEYVMIENNTEEYFFVRVVLE